MKMEAGTTPSQELTLYGMASYWLLRRAGKTVYFLLTLGLISFLHCDDAIDHDWYSNGIVESTVIAGEVDHRRFYNSIW